LVVLVGQKKAVAIAVRNASGRRRWSKLAEWLSGSAPKRVERQSFLDVAHFKGNVVETHSARSSGFGHEILMGRAVRALDRNLGAQLPAASGFRN
jgi:hypothetical protein